MGSEMGELIFKRRTEILITILAAYYITQVLNGLWVDDFWDHASVIRELIDHPWRPNHPQLGGNTPHTFFTPYSLLAAYSAKLLGINAIEVLGLYGFINIAILLYGLWIFIKTSDLENSKETYFYSILLIVFLWGSNPWGYSGFFHSDVLKFTLPYPSSFATGIVLATIGYQKEYQKNNKKIQIILISIMSTVVILTHPVAFLFLVIGFISNLIGVKGSKERILTAKSMTYALVVALIVAISWPYYSLIELIKGASDVYHQSNAGVYQDFMKNTWPLLIVAPLILTINNQVKLHRIYWMIIFLMLLYVLAWLTKKYSYGRVISYSIILLQILVANKVSSWESYIFSRKKIRSVVAIIVLIIALSYLISDIVSMGRRGLTVMNSLYKGQRILNQQSFGQIEKLQNLIEPGALVLANINNSWMLPAFGMKIIAMKHRHAFIKDHHERFVNINTFFQVSTSNEERMKIIYKYKPKYILLDKEEDKVWSVVSTELNSIENAQLVFEDNKMLLIKLH